jgi:hypothetical protein
MLVGSAALAGVAAWVIGRALSDRGLIVRLLATTLAFNVLLTTSGLIKAIGGDAKVTLASWSSGAGLRMLATLAIVGVFAIFASRRPRAIDLRWTRLRSSVITLKKSRVLRCAQDDGALKLIG